MLNKTLYLNHHLDDIKCPLVTVYYIMVSYDWRNEMLAVSLEKRWL